MSPIKKIVRILVMWITVASILALILGVGYLFANHTQLTFLMIAIIFMIISSIQFYKELK